MKVKKTLNSIFENNLFVLLLSFVTAVVIWLFVVINVSPQTTRVIKDVRVTIDETIPSQFGLEVFGESEFTVDVTVTGKKYQISTGNLSAEDITVTALTNNVDSAGFRTLQLKAEPVAENASYTISSVSTKYIDVYFDTAKTTQFVIEPEIITGDFPVVENGYASGEVNLSDTVVTVTGPSTQVNKIEKAVARYELEAPLTSNLSAGTDVVLLDDNNKSDFDYLTMSVERVVLTIPVLREKMLTTTVTFKNAPEDFIIAPLKYTISPSKEKFNILVDEYEKTVEYSIGTIDFKDISPSNSSFSFSAAETSVSGSYVDEFTVDIDLDGFSQEYITVQASDFKINNPEEKQYSVSGLNKSVVVVGKDESLKAITAELISVEVDISDVVIEEGESVEVPAVVTVKNAGCWVYGSYTVTVSA